MADEECQHGGESWYCDACKYAREIADAEEMTALRVRIRELEGALAGVANFTTITSGPVCWCMRGADSDDPFHTTGCSRARRALAASREGTK